MRRIYHIILALLTVAVWTLASCHGTDGRRVLVGISCSHPENGSQVSMNYSQAVIRVGATPVLVPVTTDSLALSDLLGRLDGLILSGGGDVDPQRYGEEMIPQCGEPDSLRDVYEMLLIDLAVRRGLPLLGICRGEQLINVYFGGTLYQDIPSQAADTTVVHNQQEPSSVATHTVRLLPGSTLSTATGLTCLRTNTHHHQAVRQLAPGLKATAWADDGIVEGFEAEDGRPVWGVQFHPEALTVAGDSSALLIFRDFVGRLRH